MGNSWVGYVRKRVSRNQNFNCAITGPTGSGKSYAALRWAELLDPGFSAERVCFMPREFLALVRSDLPAGSVILFDEIGVAMNSKMHMSTVNRALNFVFQTYRHRNFIVFMTTPHLMFLDASVRRLLHGHATTKGIDYRKKKALLDVKSLSVSQHTGKIYRKYLRVKRDGLYLPVKRNYFGLASDELVRQYETKKSAFTSDLNQRMDSLVGKAEEKELGKLKPVVLTDRQETFLSGLEQGLTVEQAAKEMGVSAQAGSAFKKALTKKGYVFKPRIEGNNTVGYEVILPAGMVKA